ncbi:MAG: hypothetical protein NTY02_08845, partial [Acidobacteria bacterium]|nr:hypothetical protein [Acidobacteriota bacterium]
ALAFVLTAVLAAPVLRVPSERIFGMEIVGRHHDPFTVMAQFEHPLAIGAFSQPLTDIPGALLARLIGPVAAYNAIILLSFPLSAVAAFLLARHLSLSPPAAAAAALAFAFSPFHVAQAAYHPHIAQTQWIPLYVLALWRCLDAPTGRTVGLLAAASAAVALSNFYGGLIAAVMTPALVAAYWLMAPARDAALTRRVATAAGGLLAIASAGVAYAWWAARDVLSGPGAFTFPREDLFRYAATWRSYLLPPIGHPLLGDLVRRLQASEGPAEGLLERQLGVGLGLLVLGIMAVVAWHLARRAAAWRVSTRRTSPLRAVPALVVAAAAALFCSLSPEVHVGAFTVIRPSGLLHDLLPMFRAYARFGVVVQLMIALLAGIGADWWWRTGTRRVRFAVVALVIVSAAEYAVEPSALWRDVLPTAAHRWVASQQTGLRVVDCAPPMADSASIPWLTGGRVFAPGGAVEDCTSAGVPATLAGLKYTHLLVRQGSWEARWFADRPVPEGLKLVVQFPDSLLLAVTAPNPPVYTADMTGYYPVEHAEQRAWRWMGDRADWIVVNDGNRPAATTAEIVLAPFGDRQQLQVDLDGRLVASLAVEGPRRAYLIGPLSLSPGSHQLTFRPLSPATVADAVLGNGDRRALSCAFGSWRWVVQDSH